MLSAGHLTLSEQGTLMYSEVEGHSKWWNWDKPETEIADWHFQGMMDRDTVLWAGAEK